MRQSLLKVRFILLSWMNHCCDHSNNSLFEMTFNKSAFETSSTLKKWSYQRFLFWIQSSSKDFYVFFSQLAISFIIEFYFTHQTSRHVSWISNVLIAIYFCFSNSKLYSNAYLSATQRKDRMFKSFDDSFYNVLISRYQQHLKWLYHCARHIHVLDLDRSSKWQFDQILTF